METNELWISFLISVVLLGSLLVWVPCLHGCERLVRWHLSGRHERMLTRQRQAVELNDASHTKKIA